MLSDGKYLLNFNDLKHVVPVLNFMFHNEIRNSDDSLRGPDSWRFSIREASRTVRLVVALILVNTRNDTSVSQEIWPCEWLY